MSESKITYPIKKYDHLGRVVYVNWDNIERTANVYWGNTDKVKIKYSYFNNEVSFDVFTQDGINIICYNGIRLDIKLPFIIFNNYNTSFNFHINKEFKKQWLIIIKKHLSEKKIFGNLLKQKEN